MIFQTVSEVLKMMLCRESLHFCPPECKIQQNNNKSQRCNSRLQRKIAKVLRESWQPPNSHILQNQLQQHKAHLNLPQSHSQDN